MTASQPALDPAAERVLDDYLTALAVRLPGPRRARREILAELYDGLVEATGARLADGTSQAQAAAGAVGEFGEPLTVAAAFAPRLAAGMARRLALGLIATGPLVGGVWLAALAASGRAVIAAAPVWRWPLIQNAGWPAGLLLAVIGAAMLAAWLTVASTGRLTRWLPTQTRLPTIAAAAAATGAGLLDLGLLLVLATHALPAPGASPWPLFAVAATASLVRCLLAGRAARRCLTLHPAPC
jgi:hypothetical protein